MCEVPQIVMRKRRCGDLTEAMAFTTPLATIVPVRAQSPECALTKPTADIAILHDPATEGLTFA